MKSKRYEGSALDEERDRKMAKKRGMSMKAWERSDEDKKQDAKYQRQMDRKSKAKR